MVSICMATYNGEKYIKEQLDSILHQLSAEDELIISDDSSTDMTLEIVKSYNDSRIKIFPNQKFSSPIYNFENALKHVRGNVVVLADQDDVWEGNKLQIIRESFEKKNDEIVLQMYNGKCMNESGKTVEDDLFRYLNVRGGLVQNIIKNSFIGCNIAFTKKLLDKALPFPKNIPMHDVWLACNAYLYGDVKIIDTKVFNYRVHKNNYSIKNNSFWQKLQWRYNLIINLLQRYLYVKLAT